MLTNLFKRVRAIELTAASGVLRVTIKPRPAWVWLLFELIGIVFFGVYMVRGWSSLSLFFRVLLLWAVGSGAIAWVYQLLGAEIVEFDAQKLTLAKQLGWSRISEYPIEDCRELEWREQSEGDHYGLQCKVGSETVKFAQYISEDESVEVLKALQTYLPNVAQKLCSNLDTSKRHFITLDLS